MNMATYFDRYLQGEYEAVWAELLAQGALVNQKPLYDDALAVVEETMKRVRDNIELLIKRLNSLGYVFGVYPNGYHKVSGYLVPHNPPSLNVEEKISRYEKFDGIGSFPLSLRMFWKIVGDVDFTGYYPGWPQFSDPLIIFPVESIDVDYSDWHYQVEEGDGEIGKYRVSISPDYYHKDNVSGGEPYKISIPNNSIDGILENERHTTTLVNYLRISFRYGGFPGLHWYDGVLPKEIAYLTDGLMAI